jgi:hypothetical protein
LVGRGIKVRSRREGEKLKQRLPFSPQQTRLGVRERIPFFLLVSTAQRLKGCVVSDSLGRQPPPGITKAPRWLGWARAR